MMNDIIFEFNKKIVNILSKESIGFSFLNKDNRKFVKHGPSRVGFDILFIGLIASYIDKKVSRDDSDDGWSRKISVIFPVLEFEKWVGKEKLLENILSFLSGDSWSISFKPRELTDLEKGFLNRKYVRKLKLEEKTITKISMLSGGLDSFIGAIDLLSANKDAVFVNIHGGGNSFVHNFEEVSNALSEHFNLDHKDVLFRTFYVAPKDGKEDTTRARSFTFFTHALALSTCFSNIKELIIPENGTISLNVPLTIGRYGSCSTRTTHPHYISMLQKLVNGLGMDIKIKNPYQFCTKGEMIINCKDRELLDQNISKTMSCSHPTSGRWHENDGFPKHCGYCLPCLIRRAAEYKAYLRFDVTDYKSPLAKTKTNQSTIRCLLLKMSTFDENRSILDIHKNGILYNNCEDFKNLYIRSMKELKSFILEYLKISK